MKKKHIAVCFTCFGDKGNTDNYYNWLLFSEAQILACLLADHHVKYNGYNGRTYSQIYGNN